MDPSNIQKIQHGQSTCISMDMESSDCYSNISPTPRERPSDISIAITNTDEYVKPSPPFSTPNPHFEKFHNYQGILYLLYLGAIVVMYPTLAQLAQLKFQNKQSPFETHGFLTNTAVVAYTTAIPTSILSFYMRAHYNSMIKKRFSTTYYIYRILKSLLCFSGILAPLSLVLVLLIPHEFIWIGYLIIIALLLIIVACNYNDRIKFLFKNGVSNLEAVRRDETSLHSTVTIGEL